MASLVHIEPGDALIVRAPSVMTPDDETGESERDEFLIGMERVVDALGLCGVIFLSDGEEVNVARFTDEELDALGLQRKAPA